MKIYDGYIEMYEQTKDGHTAKKPRHAWQNNYDHTEFDVIPDNWSGAGARLNTGVVLLDFDTEEDCKVAYDIVTKEGYKCKINHNQHHLIFKKPTSEVFLSRFNRRAINVNLLCGISCDFIVSKSEESKVLECVKFKDKLRFDGVNNDIDELDELPLCFYPYSMTANITYPYFVAQSDDWYVTLFNYRLKLFLRGYTVPQITEVIKIINTYVFANGGTSSDNLTSILNMSKLSLSEKQSYVATITDENNRTYKRFMGYDFVINHIERMHITLHEDVIVGYVNGKWYNVEEYLNTLLVKMFGNDDKSEYHSTVNRNLRALTINDVTIKKPKWNDERYTVFANGTYDWVECELIYTNYDQYQTISVDYPYDQTVKSDRYDKIMNNIFGTDNEQKKAVLEVLGSCFYKNNYAKKKFTIFYGEGNNAKSLFTDAMVKILNPRNVATRSIKALCTDKFVMKPIYNKLANIIDDSSAEYSGDTGQLKTICTGGAMDIEQKGKDAFMPEEHPYCTIIVNSNAIIRIGNGDDSKAVNKRRHVIHFTKTFNPTDSDYDRMANVKALNDDAFLTKLVAESVQAFQKMLNEKREFTKPHSSNDINNAFREVMAQQEDWIKTQDEADYLQFDIDESYKIYVTHCGANKPKSLLVFKKMVLDNFDTIMYSDKYRAFYHESKIVEGQNADMINELMFDNMSKSKYQQELVKLGFTSYRSTKLVGGQKKNVEKLKYKE